MVKAFDYDDDDVLKAIKWLWWVWITNMYDYDDNNDDDDNDDVRCKRWWWLGKRSIGEDEGKIIMINIK